MAASPLVAVRRLRNGRWHWNFVDEGSGVSLASNHTFDDLDAARRSASAAYPNVPIELAGADLPHEEPSITPEEKARPRWLRFLGVGLVVLLVVALVAPGLTKSQAPA